MKVSVLHKALLLGMLLIPLSLYAQEMDNMVEELTQTVEETGSGEAELVSLLDDLDAYHSQPLDINNANEAELLSAPFLSQTQVEAILRYRSSFGSFSTLYELLYTNAFETSDLDRIQPYIVLVSKTIIETKGLSQLPEFMKHQLLMRWSARGERAKGYERTSEEKPPVFQGDPNKAMLRYKINVSDWFSAGITAEKDAGEKWMRNNQPDFISAHVFYKPKKMLYAIALGDFNARFGQGLILWNGYSAGKYSFPTSVIRYNQGISAFAGTDENRFLRGAATTFRFGKTDITVLGSVRNIDANVSKTDSLGSPEEISSIASSGTHATISQLEDRQVLNEKIAATHLRYHSTFFEIGATAGTARYNIPLVIGNEPYKSLLFEGKIKNAASADYRFVWKNLSMAGEYAFSGNNKTATFHTLRAEPVAGNSFALAYRNYSPQYKGIRTMAFGENSEGNNEKGWTVGVELNPLSMLRLTAMADFWQYPWLRYRVNSLSEGHEYRLGTILSITKWLEIDGKYRNRIQEQNEVVDPISFPAAVKQNHWQLALKMEINDKLKTSLQYYKNQYITSQNQENGYYVFNDWIIQPSSKLKISFRQGFFLTESYYSRIYAYEFSTPWAYSIPYLAGKGTRSAVMISYILSSYLVIYGKVSLSYFKGAESTGSGDNLTNGPRQTDFSVLLNWKFDSAKRLSRK